MNNLFISVYTLSVYAYHAWERPGIISVRIHIDQKDYVVIENTVHHLYYGCVNLPRLGNLFYVFIIFIFRLLSTFKLFLKHFPHFFFFLHPFIY